MKYPTLAELNTSREMVEVFKGYNHNLRIGEGEFYEMTNLSSDNYPILSPRSRRGIYATPNDPRGMVAKDSLCYVDGNVFVMNENRMDIGLSDIKDEDGNIIPKTLISMGAYVIIMPDKIYINTKNISDYGNIEAKKTTYTDINFALCTVDGAAYDAEIQPTPPNINIPKATEDTEEGTEGGTEGGTEEDTYKIPLWLDTSTTPHTLKMYSTTTSTWTSIPTTYIKISATGIGVPFSVGDGVTISGVEEIADLASPTNTIIYAKDDREEKDGNGDTIKVSDWIVVKGMLDLVQTQPATKPITIERKMPKMDFIIESRNRLWGCRYGPNNDGAIVNEIYASKLGDFKNWNCYQSISTDSLFITLGTDGQFTGAITHLGYPIFFKENCMHKVYGDTIPFSVQDTACRGVQKGCERSLAIVNETLYYKSRSGVCAYDGSLPMEISSALGEKSYFKAAAGALGNKYYISMADSEDGWHLFVYDTLKGMWHREDETEASAFCYCRGDLYYIDRAKKEIRTVKGSGDLKEADTFKWGAVTGIIGTDSPDKKYISRMDVRMKLDVGTRVMFFAEYDSSGEWEYLFTMTGRNLQSFAVPIRPKRCDHMRLKIAGWGDAKIFSICKTVEWGSDE